MKHTYDKKTAGFRTIRNLRGYNDAEKGFPPSVIDESEYEDINVLVKRFMRGEVVMSGQPVYYDGDGSADELIAAANPLSMDGADLADVGPIKAGIEARENERKAAKAEARKSKGSKVSPAAEKGQEAPVPADSGAPKTAPEAEKPE